MWLQKLYKSIGADATLEPLVSTPMTTRDVLLRESPRDGMEDGVNEGIKSFFHSGKCKTAQARLEACPSCEKESSSAEYVPKDKACMNRVVRVVACTSATSGRNHDTSLTVLLPRLASTNPKSCTRRIGTLSQRPQTPQRRVASRFTLPSSNTLALPLPRQMGMSLSKTLAGHAQNAGHLWPSCYSELRYVVGFRFVTHLSFEAPSQLSARYSPRSALLTSTTSLPE